MPPRVLVVITSTDRRGAEVEALELAAQLTSTGVLTEVVALAPGVAGGRLGVPTLGKTALGLSTLLALRRRARQFDLVIAYGSRTLPACAGALVGSTPFVYRSIGDPDRWAGGRVRRLRTGLMIRRARGVAALWPAAAESLITLYRLTPSALAVIPNARPATHFRPMTDQQRAAARAQIGVPLDVHVVAMLGALSEEKRPLLGLEAIATVEGAWAIIAGDGSLGDEVAQAADRLLSGHHAILGSVDDVRTVLAAADVVLLTSRTEGMPGVLIEAALSGVPSVSTAVGAVPRMVDDGLPCHVIDVDSTAAGIGDAVQAAIAAGPVAPPLQWSWPVVLPLWQAALKGWLPGQPSEITAA